MPAREASGRRRSVLPRPFSPNVAQPARKVVRERAYAPRALANAKQTGAQRSELKNRTPRAGGEGRRLRAGNRGLGRRGRARHGPAGLRPELSRGEGRFPAAGAGRLVQKNCPAPKRVATDDEAVTSGLDETRDPRIGERGRPRVAPARDRIPRRRRARRRGARGRAARFGRAVFARRAALISLTCAAGLVAVGYAGGRHLASADRFAIAEVEVRGAARVSAGEIRARLGGLGGQNLFLAEISKAASRVERHPWVESARARRELPDRLSLELEERRPAAVVHMDGLYLVDEAGVPFVRARAGSDETDGLLIITGIERRAFRRDPEAGHAQLREALRAAEIYARGDRPALGEIHFGPEGRLTLVTYDDAVEIRTGARSAEELGAWLEGYDNARDALSERERATARLFRVEGHGAPERVSVDFSGRRTRD